MGSLASKRPPGILAAVPEKKIEKIVGGLPPYSERRWWRKKIPIEYHLNRDQSVKYNKYNTIRTC
jgi:hypothetical protein